MPSWRCELTAQVANDQEWLIEEYAILEFVLGSTRYAHIVYITPDITDEAILGLDFLAKHGIDIRSGRVGYRDKNPALVLTDSGSVVPCIYGQGVSSQKCKMVTVRAISIPAGTSKMVEVQAPAGSLLEWHEKGDVTGILSSPFMKMETTVSLRDGVTRMLVCNSGASALDFLPGRPLATFLPRKVRRHEDAQGNPYLYVDLNGHFVERLDVCLPWEGHARGKTLIDRLRPIGLVPTAKLVHQVSGDQVQRNIIHLTDDERSVLLEAMMRDRQGPIATAVNAATMTPEGGRIRRVVGTGEKASVDEAEREIDEKIDGDEGAAYTSEDATVGSGNLKPEEERNLRELLRSFEHVLSPNQNAQYPNTKMPPYAKMKIVVPPGTKPYRIKPYPISKHKMAALEERIQLQLRQGMIEPSSSEWSAPSFVIQKANGTGNRLLIDYRGLNGLAEKNAWPLPRIDSVASKLSGAKFFTSLDLTDFFYQVSVEKESRKYTAFSTPFAHYQYRVCPQGLATSPNFAQSVMDRMFEDLKREDDCFIYIDDILIWGDTLEEHNAKLARVLQRLGENGMKAKAPKCCVAMQELRFLGFIFGGEGCKPDPRKVETISELARPTGRKATTRLRAILGLVGFYRQFIKDYSELVSPLNDLLKEGRDVNRDWGEEHDSALNAVKVTLSTEPVLAYPDFDRPFMVKTDASKVALGAVLAQVDDSGNERVLEYASKSFSSTQRNWDTTHRETFAVVFALNRWRRYIEGSKTRVVTDHAAILWLRWNKYKDTTGKLVRWFYFLDRFNISLEHRKGEELVDADALSRMHDYEDQYTGWGQEDPNFTWMYELIRPYLRKGSRICEVSYGGPSCVTRLEEFDVEVAHSREIADAMPEADTYVSCPDGKTGVIRKLTDKLEATKKPWALWIPLSVVQTLSFPKQFQLIILQGVTPYGSGRGGRPERGAWVTHGLGLPKDIMTHRVTVSNGQIFCRRHHDNVRVTIDREANVRRAKVAPRKSVPFRSDSAAALWRRNALRVAPAVRQVELAKLLQLTDPGGECSLSMPPEEVLRRAPSILSGASGRQLEPPKKGTRRCKWFRRKVTSFSETHLLRIRRTKRSSVPDVKYEEALRVLKNADHGCTWKLSKEDEVKMRLKLFDFYRTEIESWEHKKRTKCELPIVEDLSDGQRILRFFQQEDPESAQVKTLMAGEATTDISLYGGPKVRYYQQDGLLRIEDTKGNHRDFVPAALRPHYLHVTHRTRVLNHPGITTMNKVLARHLYWPCMQADVEEFVGGCLACLRSKTSKPTKNGASVRVIPEKPLSVVGMDVYGPLPPSKEGYKYVLTIIDHFSRFVRFVPLKDVDKVSVANAFFKEWISAFGGFPELVTFDAGSNFKSSFFLELGRLLGIKMHPFPAESQNRNGKAERIHKYLGERLRIWKKKDDSSWIDALPYIQLSHHLLPIPRFGKSPLEILFGVEAKVPFLKQGRLQGSYSRLARAHVENHAVNLKTIQSHMREIELKIQKKALDKYNLRRLEMDLPIGGNAMVYTKGTKTKEDCLWSDLVQVVAKIDEVTYLVKYPSGENVEVPVDRLKLVQPWSRDTMDGLGPFLMEEEYPELLFEGDAAGDPSVKALEALPIHRLPADSVLVNGPPGEYWHCVVGDTLEKAQRRPRPAKARDRQRSKVTTGKSRNAKHDIVTDVSDHKTTTPSYSTLAPDGTTTPGLARDSTNAEGHSYQYGDFVAYWAGEGKSRGWYIGQWLSQEEAGPGEVQVRGMQPYKGKPGPKAAWHYVWTTSNARSKAVIAPIGYGPLEKPHSPKTTSGNLAPEWLVVPEEDIVMPVVIGKGQIIMASSWKELITRARIEDMAGGGRRDTKTKASHLEERPAKGTKAKQNTGRADRGEGMSTRSRNRKKTGGGM